MIDVLEQVIDDMRGVDSRSWGHDDLRPLTETGRVVVTHLTKLKQQSGQYSDCLLNNAASPKNVSPL